MSSATKRHVVREIKARKIRRLQWSQRAKGLPMAADDYARITRSYWPVSSKYNPVVEDQKRGFRQ